MLGRFVLILAVVLPVVMQSQTGPDKYWIQFTDKSNSVFSLDHPEAFLSPNAIERRTIHQIGYSQNDLPVNENYIQEVLNTCGCSLHQKSKWFNAITISTSDTAVFELIRQLPFVSQIKSVRRYHREKEDVEEDEQKKASYAVVESSETDCTAFPEYGSSFRQIEMLNGHLLHALSFTGKGVNIAQLDAGWNMTDRLPAFEKLRTEGRIKLVHDFVFHDNNTIYTLGNHGTFVLSTMAGFLADSLVGTAPDANYYLMRTEDPLSENLVEEDNWVAAAEMCDSLGIDIINSSLGYSLFDNPMMNHSYSDMDGNTTRCSIAADIAASKGILVVNSAGNSGDDPWHYITAPSDGDSVLCVGAVDAFLHHASFSSYGPSSDGDVKPNVMTMGKACTYADLDSTVSRGNGTSFSSPIMAGMAACLAQAFPLKSNMEIMHAIQESSSEFPSSSDSLGYGIPDLMKAFITLGGSLNRTSGDLEAVIYPNPCYDELNVLLMDIADCDIRYEIYDTNGNRVFEGSDVLQSSNHGVLTLKEALRPLANKDYILHLSRAGRHSVLHFQKIQH